MASKVNKWLPYPLTRLIDHLMPSMFVISGVLIGFYTFLHILFIQRKPRLAFSLSHWQDQSFARGWNLFGPMVAEWDAKIVSALEGTAEGRVLDVG